MLAAQTSSMNIKKENEYNLNSARRKAEPLFMKFKNTWFMLISLSDDNAILNLSKIMRTT
jgi:hypothetical protein